MEDALLRRLTVSHDEQQSKGVERTGPFSERRGFVHRVPIAIDQPRRDRISFLLASAGERTCLSASDCDTIC